MRPDPAWHLARPESPTGVGVLVVHGSSGRIVAALGALAWRQMVSSVGLRSTP